MSVSRPTPDRLARLLGLFSLGLGSAQVANPDGVNRLIGLAPTAEHQAAMRGVGVQELLMGLPLVRRKAPAVLLWGRVAGDVMHLGMLAAALDGKHNDRARLRTTIGVLGGVTALDLVAALKASRASASQDPTLRARATVTIRRDAQDVYAHWRDLVRLPEFMTHVRSVEQRGDGRTHWVVDSPAGALEWDAEITQDMPARALAWRSVPGSKIENAGIVRFTPAPGDRGTEVTVELRFTPPGGRLGGKVAKLLGEHPEQQIRDDLRRLKQVLETGEIVRSDGSPNGVRSQRMVAQHRAQPPR